MSLVQPSARRHILLTGGAGFIGSHLAEALLRRGFQLTILDSLDDFYSPARKQSNLAAIRKAGEFHFLPTDLCDYDALSQAVRPHPPDIMIHLAARAGVRPSIEQPRLYQQVNVAGTLNILELARELKVARLIFGSSSSVYGATSRAPFSENDVELRPISPYAATKLAGELLCYTYAHVHRVSSICLRFFTVYGPRQRPDLAIHKFTALMEAGLPIPVFGDGSMGRDYTFIDDIVSGILASIDYQFPAAADPFEVFNLGNSSPVKLSELIQHLELATGRKALIHSMPVPSGDVPLTWANIAKASQKLNYLPQTSFQDGLKKFVDWYRSESHR